MRSASWSLPILAIGLALLTGCAEEKVLWTCNCSPDVPPHMCSADEPVLYDSVTGETLSDCCGSTGEIECDCPDGEDTCTCNPLNRCVEDGAFQ